MVTVLLSTTYFGPVQWYQKLHRAEHVMIEQWENFQKQTYRNRCLIATTNGVQALTVPVEKNAECIKDLRISDHGNWRHLHWNALQSAYGESPFFEYYQDDIRPFFESRWSFLLDFNEAIRQKMCELLDIQPKVEYSGGWREESSMVSRIIGLPLIPNTLHRMMTLRPRPITRCIRRNMVFWRISLSSISFLIWDQRVFSTFETWNETFLKHFSLNRAVVSFIFCIFATQ